MARSLVDAPKGASSGAYPGGDRTNRTKPAVHPGLPDGVAAALSGGEPGPFAPSDTAGAGPPEGCRQARKSNLYPVPLVRKAPSLLRPSLNWLLLLVPVSL